MEKYMDKYRLLMENMMDGFAYHQIVRDESGTPMDYIFLDVNPAFEAITGLNRENIIGKPVTEVMVKIKEGFDWLGVYGQVANTGKSVRFENYSESLDLWFEVSAYSAEHGYFASLIRDVTESRRMKESLVASETRYRRLFESAKDVILILDAETGEIINANPYLVGMLGYPEEKIIGKTIWEIGSLKNIVASRDNFLTLQQQEYIRYENLPVETADGREVTVEFVSNVYLEGDRKVIQCNIRDITERKRSELFQNLSAEILAILNESGDFHEMIQRILRTIKSATGFDAVGMRLQKGEDYPYYEQVGFSDDFLRTENTLATRDASGDICRRADGSIGLECTCGLVISGNTDPSNPMFTKGGSSWTNDSFPLLGIPENEEIRLFPRNQCIHQGYASVALVPIRKNQHIIGLLQLNDHRKDQFNHDAITVLEEIGTRIGEALARKQMEDSLKKRLDELEAIYSISSTLRTAETLDEMLTLMLDETLNVLDTDSGAICLYDPAKGHLGFTATQGWVNEFDDVFIKPGEGIAGKVFASGQVVVSKEYGKDPLVKYAEKSPKGWGGACLPLRAETDVVGVIFVSVPLPREITAEELKLLASLTEMAGTAIHRLGLYEKNLRHLDQIQALRNIDMTIASSMDIYVTYKVILDEVTRMLSVDAAAILRLDPNTGMLKYEAWRGFRSVNPSKLNLSMGEGLANQVAMERKSVQIVNLREVEENYGHMPFLKKEEAHSYYAVPLINKGRVEGVMEILHREPLEASKEWLEFLDTLAGQTAIAIDNADLIHNMANTNLKLIQAYDNTIQGWSRALDLRDKETGHHSQRVTEMTVNMASVMGVSVEELGHIRRGAFLHDIGKMGVSDNILLKPGPLTDEEWVIMQRHPLYAFEMLSSIEYLRPALDIPYCHHEKWDGTGYPRGLKGDEIPLAARIFAVVDVYDALTSDRPYRKAWSSEKALEHIRQGSRGHFDPQVVELFLKEVGEWLD